MIHVPTAAWAHTVFDLGAWMSGMALGAALYRWRLKAAVERVASKVEGRYFLALALGAAIGAWVAGSVNTLADTRPALSHSSNSPPFLAARGLIG
jgi:hypothetical protein